MVRFLAWSLTYSRACPCVTSVAMLWLLSLCEVTFTKCRLAFNYRSINGPCSREWPCVLESPPQLWPLLDCPLIVCLCAPAADDSNAVLLCEDWAWTQASPSALQREQTVCMVLLCMQGLIHLSRPIGAFQEQISLQIFCLILYVARLLGTAQTYWSFYQKHQLHKCTLDDWAASDAAQFISNFMYQWKGSTLLYLYPTF